VPERGLEHHAKNTGKTDIPAEGGAVGAGNGPFDTDLQAIILRWPTLTDATKSDILEMIRSADGVD
jgi:hypothetical protein